MTDSVYHLHITDQLVIQTALRGRTIRYINPKEGRIYLSDGGVLKCAIDEYEISTGFYKNCVRFELIESPIKE